MDTMIDRPDDDFSGRDHDEERHDLSVDVGIDARENVTRTRFAAPSIISTPMSDDRAAAHEDRGRSEANSTREDRGTRRGSLCSPPSSVGVVRARA